jgi:hypothetical protein
LSQFADQVVEVERLGEHHYVAQLLIPAFRFGNTRDNDRRNVLQRRVLLALGEKLPAVHHRHREIEHDRGNMTCRRRQILQRLVAV